MKRILFFHQGKFSHTTSCLLAGLQERFPSAEIRDVDVHRALKGRRLTLLANGLHALRAYGSDLLLRRRSFDDAFFGTRCLFHAVRQIALQAHDDWPADCSLQTQSMYDCSSPRTPHMVYTDHTYLTCTEYPDYGRAAWNPVRPDWLIDLERTIFGNAACILTMSRNVTRTLLDRYRIPASKVSCVRIGCNASLQRILQIPCELRRYRAKAILFAGMEWERKGGEQLLDAFRAVRHQVPDARLVLAGRHPDIRQENVQVVPPVPLEQIPDLMANASIFCLPSRLEPFGIAWLEAMAAGLPVIGLNLGAAPDFIRPDQTGVLVEPDDIDGLARALVDLLANPKKCCTLGQAGRALVTSDYTWSQTCRAIAVHMDHAVAARGRTLADCPSM